MLALTDAQFALVAIASTVVRARIPHDGVATRRAFALGLERRRTL